MAEKKAPLKFSAQFRAGGGSQSAGAAPGRAPCATCANWAAFRARVFHVRYNILPSLKGLLKLAASFGCVPGEWQMSRKVLPALVFAAGVAGMSTVAFAYMAPAPAPIPVAFERPMGPIALCAAEAQEQFLSGPAFDSFMHSCGQAAVANICDAAASAKRLSGKSRAAFAKRCAVEIEQAER
jgi:hypothetical protein